ncbi:enoyl-CoA hydratase/isomerase family protein [Chelatococcus sp. SYSU_G07232]|uniref:Enoyl-CoA hydratase/isomerase family protein n=1 Tax=Chelatococcus albus TaxID=3047466 RepID=A0ABT7AM67_9HYPH|nr:enoyl-CoA hydratase/isomerase family protein [Chelatococcus sp. SYSU_G07232]MDJ1160042.1 enoyl-CoA hydratase/isomerase family protein [Chelatococcus sp. SYSU_G07232]
MHGSTAAPLVRVTVEDGIARVMLDRPARHNSLVPALMDALNEALADLRRSDLTALVLAGAGRSFSTGGDVAAFAAVPRGERRAYAQTLVGGLNRAILALLDMPCPVIACVHGPVTGGSLGLVLAADLVAMAEGAFVAPYYVEVGFAPDGGWTAMLPARIGEAQARAIQLLNRHVTAAEAVALGIATVACPPEAIDSVVDGWTAALQAKAGTAVRATRALLMPPERRAAIAAGLEREREHFLRLIDEEAVEAGMRWFLDRSSRP